MADNSQTARPRHGGIGNQNAAKDEKADTQLYIRCTKADKAAWVKAAAPGKLSAWVVDALNEKAKAK